MHMMELKHGPASSLSCLCTLSSFSSLQLGLLHTAVVQRLTTPSTEKAEDFLEISLKDFQARALIGPHGSCAQSLYEAAAVGTTSTGA